MDARRYIEALEKGDAPDAIVPLIIHEAAHDPAPEALVQAFVRGMRSALRSIEDRTGSYGSALKNLRETIEGLETITEQDPGEVEGANHG